MATRKTVAIDGDTYELSDDFLSQVLETAVEGGCSYWADVSVEEEDDGDADPRERGRKPRDFDLTDYIEDEDDADDDDAPLYRAASFLVSKDPTQGGTLDLEGIADAIERIAGNEVDVPPALREIIVAAVRDADPDEIDAEAADCIVQVGLFDEIVFS